MGADGLLGWGKEGGAIGKVEWCSCEYDSERLGIGNLSIPGVKDLRGLRLGGPVPVAFGAETPNFGVDSRSWLFLPSESPANDV